MIEKTNRKLIDAPIIKNLDSNFFDASKIEKGKKFYSKKFKNN